MHNYSKLIIFIFLMLSGFAIGILILAWPLLTGEMHILDVPQPMDPFEILRGQYITINYEINNIPNIDGIDDSSVGDIIYVNLKKDESGISRPNGFSLNKPDDESFIKGRIKSVSGNTIRAEYGIEQFFFERGASFSMQNMTVEVKISKSGQARISNILQNGEPIEIEYKDVGFAS